MRSGDDAAGMYRVLRRCAGAPFPFPAAVIRSAVRGLLSPDSWAATLPPTMRSCWSVSWRPMRARTAPAAGLAAPSRSAPRSATGVRVCRGRRRREPLGRHVRRNREPARPVPRPRPVGRVRYPPWRPRLGDLVCARPAVTRLSGNAERNRLPMTPRPARASRWRPRSSPPARRWPRWRNAPSSPATTPGPVPTSSTPTPIFAPRWTCWSRPPGPTARMQPELPGHPVSMTAGKAQPHRRTASGNVAAVSGPGCRSPAKPVTARRPGFTRRDYRQVPGRGHGRTVSPR